MPEGAVYVGRPSRWGNRYVVGLRPHPDHLGGGVTPCDCPVVADARAAVDLYRADIWLSTGGGRRLDRFESLRGHDLACWCPVACGVDVDLGWDEFGGPYDPCALPAGHEGHHDPSEQPAWCHADVLLELANR